MIVEQDGIYKKVSSRIDSDWYPYHTDEWFTHDDVVRFFEWRDQDTKKAVSKKLYHDTAERKHPLLEKQGKAFRLVDEDAEEIDWQAADPTQTIDIALPFGLHDLVKFFPKTIILVAGEPNAGKTSFLNNVIKMNWHKHIITLYNSESSPEEMKERWDNFGEEIPNPPPFKTKRRYENFADIIDPNGFSVIDYIDADNEYWSIGAEISKIHKRLINGICVCAIQKKETAKNFKGETVTTNSGYGGTPTKKRPALYLLMTSFPNRLIIEKAKTWKDKSVNPNGMAWTYSLIGGAKFINIERDYNSDK